ncbi:2,3-bisphosphoglycerate-independent phosphoglycerate mutase [Desulfosarcina sp. BuS5]|uniref:2,3-bisphosphoglycerate-independent phosphoglycerate mutase n=1 Tax=Desulfosarcina sp. BuS5 TaxID=933262 RepID=UPI0004891597|nr:2,3-bisphosphoglycerate-independent phosphoglycerate mutase [Desulfosarcina sp. BuS5]WDN89013.1 2,3-bisphosphoglycerate-independent phosphoglycerate mutase [Desulfosarcina sp. BuS5]
MKTKRPVCLIIMDGWGIAPADAKNALAKADTPNLDYFFSRYPNALLRADGLNVGLPEGNQGNSEVGHLNIGSGRIMKQMLVRINSDIENGSFYENKVLKGAVDHCKKNGSNLHLMGLIQDQGVHAVTSHCNALLMLCSKMDFYDVYVHIFSDGRDTPPKSAAEYIAGLEEGIKKAGLGKIGTITGRYYAMDRDMNWDRIKIAYDGLTKLEGSVCRDRHTALEQAYAAAETDEFIKPKIIKGFPGIKDGDAVINFNFRLDRAREITHAFTDTHFGGFKRDRLDIKYIGFTDYYDNGEFETAFPPVNHKNILGKVLSDHGLKQLRCAETEKYAHVTFFFNDSTETPFEGEDRIMVPSPKVATYDLQPEMSAYLIRDKILEAIKADKYDVIICNFANADMVGHTGVFNAAVKAGEVVDECVGSVHGAVLAKGGAVIITADHGNGECMLLDDGSPMTAHTTNPVPVILCGAGDVELIKDGKLCDLAPTMLKILRINQPPEMTGRPLF